MYCFLTLVCTFVLICVVCYLLDYNNFPCKICVKAHIVDATAYLLERTGDIIGAFKLIQEVSGI